MNQQKMGCRLFAVAICMLWMGTTPAQVKALTEYGDTVMLLDNGRWQMIDDFREAMAAEPVVLETSSIIYSKPATATEVEKKEGEMYEAWYNDKKWKAIDASVLNPQADIAFQTNGGDEAYGMIIYETLNLPKEKLREVALANAERVSTSLEVQKQEYRQVNGHTMIYMELSAQVSGLDLQYYYYIGNTSNTSIQYIAFTGQAAAQKMEADLIDLLNGLILKEGE